MDSQTFHILDLLKDQLYAVFGKDHKGVVPCFQEGHIKEKIARLTVFFAPKSCQDLGGIDYENDFKEKMCTELNKLDNNTGYRKLNPAGGTGNNFKNLLSIAVGKGKSIEVRKQRQKLASTSFV